MNEETIFKAVLPVAQQETTALIATTTPSGSDHISSEIIHIKDDEGYPVIKTVRLGKPCDECLAKQILCTHAENTVGEGLSRKKRSRFFNLYKGREHIANAELQGEVGGMSSKLFQPMHLQRCRISVPQEVPTDIDVLFLTSDPAQGGQCEWATIGAYFDRTQDKMVICLIDSFRIHPPTIENMEYHLTRSITTLRRAHKSFANVPIVYCVESAPKMFAWNISSIAQKISRQSDLDVTCMCEVNGNEPGVPKNNFNTQIMVDISSYMLENDGIRFSSHCTTSVTNATVEQQKDKLIGQLGKFERKIIDEKDPSKVRIDGKTSGGTNDDLAVAFIMQGYWYQHFWTSNSELYRGVKDYSRTWRLPFGQREFPIREIPYNPEKRRRTKKLSLEQSNNNYNQQLIDQNAL